MKQYYADQVSIVVGAIIIEDGLDDGPFLRIENVESTFGHKSGVDGELVRYKIGNKAAIVTIILMQTSSSNTALSALHNLDIASNNGAGIVPFAVMDRSGNAVYTSASCWIEKPPDAEFDREPGPREWMLVVDNIKRVDAGN